MISIPNDSEYNPFYKTYVSKIDNNDLLEFLTEQSESLPELLRANSDKADYRYGEDKWTVAEVLNHINDAERVFSYRAFAIARGEKQALPGMDQNDYADAADTSNRDFESLIKEFEAIRASTLALLSSLNEKQLSNEGMASGFPVTTRGLVGIIAGHAVHHVQILKERYF